MPPALTPVAPVTSDAVEFEKNNVHTVYDAIADHFSSTRYKPWPVIATFMSSLAVGSVGIDSGCGNGKYLPLGSPDVLTVGLDRSANLLKIAQRAGESPRDVALGDALDDCWRAGCFDFAISIACLHHLATPQRRQQAVQTLLRAVSPRGGRALIYVWATEQDELSKRVVPVAEGESKAQDVLVPWVHSSGVLQRYYHLFNAGELRQLVFQAAKALELYVGTDDAAPAGTQGVEIVADGWERSNWYIELRRWAT